MKQDLIEYFFEKKLITEYNTKKSYKGNINKFFRLLGKDYNTYFDKTKSLDDYDDDLKKVFMILHEQNVPLITRKTFFNSIKQFFVTIDKRLKDLDFWDTLKTRLKGAEPISDKFVPNKDDLKIVISHGNTLSRAMFLIMSSTGCRIGELLALYPEDINTKTKPAQVKIWKTYDYKSKNKVKEMTKTKRGRLCFLTDEVKSSYLEWMKERDSYLQTSIKKSNYEKLTSDKRIFPMSDENARTIWGIMVKKSGLYEKDRRTNRLTLHPHCIRSFFRTYFGNGDVAEILIGHRTGMDKYYLNMKPEDLAKEFMKFQHNVTIFETEVSDERIELLEEQMMLRDKKISELEAQLKPLTEFKDIMEGEISVKDPDDFVKRMDKIDSKLKDSQSKDEKIKLMRKQMQEMMKKMEELEKE